MKYTASSTSAPLCNQCGSPLVKIQKKTESMPGQKFPITITTFRCSNQECQDRIDKEKKDRLQKQEERAQKKQQRTA